MYSKTRKIAVALMLVLTLAWLAFIFSNSMKNAAESSEQSATVYEKIEEISQNIGVENPPKVSEIRTFAHFFEFFVLGILVSVDAIMLSVALRSDTSKKAALGLLLGVAFSVACAIVDEIIQIFSEGRASDIMDVLVDSLGVLAGSAIVGGIVIVILHMRRKRATVTE